MKVIATSFVSASAERMFVMAFLSIVLHAFFITSVGFTVPEIKKEQHPPIAATIVLRKTEVKVEDAELIAQANQEGGGDMDTNEVPTTETPAPFPDKTAKSVTTAPPPQIAAPEPKKPEIKQLTTPKPSTHKVVEVVEAVKPPEKPVKEVVVEDVAEETIITPPAPITAAQLMMQTRASIASIQSNLDRKFEASSKRKREKFISARTKEKHYASYMNSWIEKVERIGELNYPQEAHRKKISGVLRLDVALYPNGTIHSIKILKSSGYKMLDNAALRIVRLSAPFAPFTKKMRKEEVDILHITRTWEFSYKGLTTRK